MVGTAVPVVKPKPPAGVGVVRGTEKYKMLPLLAAVDWVANAKAVFICMPVLILLNGQRGEPQETEANVVKELLVQVEGSEFVSALGSGY